MAAIKKPKKTLNWKAPAGPAEPLAKGKVFDEMPLKGRPLPYETSHPLQRIIPTLKKEAPAMPPALRQAPMPTVSPAGKGDQQMASVTKKKKRKPGLA